MAQDSSVDSTFRILTVGDGDWTLSRALVRAYGGKGGHCSGHSVDVWSTKNDWELTATTLLPSAQELILCYPHTAPSVLQELGHCPTGRVEIQYNVDATQLHRRFSSSSSSSSSRGRLSDHEGTFEEEEEEIAEENSSPMHNQHSPRRRRRWNAILFHHPHLGVFDSEQEQIIQHQRLLAHYLWSASQCLVDAVNDSEEVPQSEYHRSRACGIIHLCLCGNQPQSWQLLETCHRLGLQIVAQEPVTKPFHSAVLGQPHWTVRPPHQSHAQGNNEEDKNNNTHNNGTIRKMRRARHGKLCNNQHWLVSYGYQHQRTQGQLLRRSQSRVNLEGSIHYIIVRQHTQSSRPLGPASYRRCIGGRFDCDICLAQFDTRSELLSHFKSPALPPPTPPAPAESSSSPLCGKKPSSSTSSSLLVPTHNLEHVQENPKNEDDHDDLFCSISGSRGGAVVGEMASVDTARRGVYGSSTPPESLRLRKYVQKYWGCSKGQAIRLIVQGQVSLNHQVVTDSTRWVSADDTIVSLLASSTSSMTLSLPKEGESGGGGEQILYTTTTTTAATKRTAQTTSSSFSRINHPWCGSSQVEIRARWSLCLSPLSLPSTTTPTKPTGHITMTLVSNNDDPTTLGDKVVLLVVAWKPVGMRCLGRFGGARAPSGPPTTLEAHVTQQLAAAADDEGLSSSSSFSSSSSLLLYHCWSRLDTGCSGFCVLAATPPSQLHQPKHRAPLPSPSMFQIEYSFTLLVHGHVPDSWRIQGQDLELPLHLVRQWKRKTYLQQLPTKQPQDQPTDDTVIPNDSAPQHEEDKEFRDKDEDDNGDHRDHWHGNYSECESRMKSHVTRPFLVVDKKAAATAANDHALPASSLRLDQNDSLPPYAVVSYDAHQSENVAPAQSFSPPPPKEELVGPIHVRVMLVEQTTDPTIPPLSTLCVVTTRTVSGIASLICHALRHYRKKKDDVTSRNNNDKNNINNDDDDDHHHHHRHQEEEKVDDDEGYRDVGDRFSRDWDAQRLPRSMRYRLKHRLCMALTNVKVSYTYDCGTAVTALAKDHPTTAYPTTNTFDCSQPIPDKWRALYWQTFLLNGQCPVNGTRTEEEGPL